MSTRPKKTQDDIFKDMLSKAFGNKELDAYEKGIYEWLDGAPKAYHNSTEMVEFFKKNPNASLEELGNYWTDITPKGPAPDIDPEELLRDDD